MDRLVEIKQRNLTRDEVSLRRRVDIDWLIAEVETLRQAAHGDQVVIQRLRREVDHWVAIAEDAQAKLARTKQLAVSLTERPMR